MTLPQVEKLKRRLRFTRMALAEVGIADVRAVWIGRGGIQYDPKLVPDEVAWRADYLAAFGVGDPVLCLACWVPTIRHGHTFERAAIEFCLASHPLVADCGCDRAGVASRAAELLPPGSPSIGARAVGSPTLDRLGARITGAS